LFFGHFWTKQDAIVANVPRSNYSYGDAWRFGITYNLSAQISKVKF
jgi:hypothetical protein